MKRGKLSKADGRVYDKCTEHSNERGYNCVIVQLELFYIGEVDFTHMEVFLYTELIYNL